MKFEKAPAWIVEVFDAAFLPTGGERRKMFGYPAGFVNGLMCCGVFGKSIFVRLNETDREALLKEEGAAYFDPMGTGARPMRNYVVVPPMMVDENGNTARLVREGGGLHADAAAEGGEKEGRLREEEISDQGEEEALISARPIRAG